MSKRYVIIEDESGHQYLCPSSLAKEVEKSLKDVCEYWSTQNYDLEPPQDLAEYYKLPIIEGETLSFEKPKLNGEEVDIPDVDDPRQMKLDI